MAVIKKLAAAGLSLALVAGITMHSPAVAAPSEADWQSDPYAWLSLAGFGAGALVALLIALDDNDDDNMIPVSP